MFVRCSTFFIWASVTVRLCIITVCVADYNFHSTDDQHPANVLGATVGDNDQPHFERINGSNVLRMYGKKGREEKTWFDGREMKHVYCVLPSKCEKLKNNTCLGSHLPYTHTSLDLTDSYSQERTRERLHMYRALMHVPKCWAVIQPFLCAVFMPKCERIDNKDYLYMPSFEMCRITQEPCRLLYNTTYFPDYLKCNDTMYPSKCTNDVREMKFNSTGQCIAPLVPADSAANYYKDIDNCGLKCQDPLYTDDEHRQVQKLIGWGAGICLACNLLTIFTFVIDWQNANKYPGLIIFYINVCFMMSCLGWLAQFTPGGREEIVCRKDGTLRHSEPSAGENLSCIVVFVLVYYFLIAAMVWFVIFTYAWHMSFRAIRQMHERIDKKGSYFHLVAWSLPLVLTITIMALSEVDGNWVVGICFVGYLNQPMRIALLLGPIMGVLLVGGFFLGGGMIKLVQLKISSRHVISARASNKIRETIVRMGLCTLFILVFILATIVCHVHEVRNAGDWAQSLRNFIICKISSTFVDNYEQCKMGQRPSVAVLQLHLLCLFGSGILMSSWVWTHSTVDIWTRCIKRKIGIAVEEPVKLQKHKLIAQAFAKRKEFQDQGRLSINFHNSHTDPVGLNLNIDSTAASHDFSSTFAQNLPRFVNRRCALTGAATSSSHNNNVRRSSMADSEISFSVRHVSVESRRNSIDSQVSVKIAEMKTKVARGRSKGGGGGKTRGRTRKFNRRESSTSVESHSRIFNAKSKSYKRRSATAGLDPMQINALLGNPKLLLPFLTTQTMQSSDEDRNDDDYDDNGEVNSTSVRVKNIDLCLKHEFNRKGGRGRDSSGLGRKDEVDKNEELNRLLVKHSRNVDNINNTTDDEKISLGGGRSNTNGLDSLALIKNYMEGNIRAGGNDTASSKASVKTRNSGKSNRSRKSFTKRSKRTSGRSGGSMQVKSKELVEFKPEENFYCPEYGDSSIVSSFDSMDFSNVDLKAALGGTTLHSSSYSGISKATNSRNSKRSCDVATQANADEIVTASNGHHRMAMDSDEEDSDEEHLEEDVGLMDGQIYVRKEMVVKMNRGRATTSTVGTSAALKKRDDLLMSESDKLKMLLLPSPKCHNL